MLCWSSIINYPSLNNHSLPTLGITFINIVVPRISLVRPLAIFHARLLTHFTATVSQGHFLSVRPLFFFAAHCRRSAQEHSTFSPQRALHSIFCNRVVLQILKYRAESPPPLTPNNHGPRSRSAYAKTLEVLTSLQPITFFTTTTTDEVEMDSASILEREGWIG